MAVSHVLVLVLALAAVPCSEGVAEMQVLMMF